MHTPVTEFLVLKRRQRQIRQQDLAKILNVVPSYVSAVEGGRRLPRSKAFWKQVSKALNLNASEEQDMQEAIRRSAPTLKIPSETSQEIREILFDLVDRGDTLSPALIEIVRIATKASHSRLGKERP
ncbi:MAG: helix-turn-helix transcriptional regulator [Thiobacillus sp.]